MARRPGSVAVLFLVVILSVTGCAASLHGGKHAQAKLDPDPFNPDLELANLAVDGQEVGQIPVTLLFEKKRDYVFTFSIEGLGEKIYVFRNPKAGASFTIDMMGGQPVAVDDSTGDWVALSYGGGKWNDDQAVEENGGEPIAEPEVREESPPPAEPAAREGFEQQIQLPILVRLINGKVVEATSVQPVGRGSYRIVPPEGPEFILDGLAIFTIESRTGQSFTDYVLRQGHSVP
jgi:hypothetical protein